MWVNIKTLRFNFTQYLMLVIVFPLSYLIINLISGSHNSLIHSITGILISMIFSLFINLQANLVATSNNTSVIELYAVYQATPIYVFIGQCSLHFLMTLPLILAAGCAMYLQVEFISIWKLVLWIITTLFFFFFVSIFLGSILKNPNLATPVINLIYMLIIMITPIYNNFYEMKFITKILYSFNPLSHIVSLWYWCFNLKKLANSWISFIILYGIALLLGFFDYRRWKEAKAVEKLNVF